MSNNFILMTPGPVKVSDRVLNELSLPVIHHRTDLFKKIFTEVSQKLKKVFMTSQPVLLHHSTGSGAMESSVVNCLSPDDKVLVINGGKFGERWIKICKAYSLEVYSIDLEWGKAFNVKNLSDFLENNTDIKAVFCQACETSTGVLFPIKEMGKIIKKLKNTIFIVDAITAVGAIPLKMDKWGIDVMIGGSQKAFMLPAGISLIALSEKSWSFTKESKIPKFYFNLHNELKAYNEKQTFFSASASLIRSLNVSLDIILENGVEKYWEKIINRANFLRNAFRSLGLELFPEVSCSSLSVIKVPSHLDGQKIRQRLEEFEKIIIMGGQDKLKGKILRIGHMGDISKSDMVKVIISLAKVIRFFDNNFIDENNFNKIINDLS